MTLIDLKDVTVIYPMLGRDSKVRVTAKDALKGAGSFIRDSAERGRGVVALENVTLSARPGDRVGLVGRNGSGKSTLLRTIAGIYEPFCGEMEIQGSIAGLFSAGLGMRPEASGYRNIELSGLVAGFSIEQVREMMEGIAEFTELGDYLNMPVRTYSNGMMMRLRFATATAFAPEILLMDEWLGAGDPDFQRKAQNRMSELVERAGIMVLASHNHNLIKRSCESAAWLDRGILRAFGPADAVIECAEGRLDPRELSGPPDAAIAVL